MKNTALMILMLLASMAYGQSNKVNLKGTNEVGLNYNRWNEIYNGKINSPYSNDYFTIGYGRWITNHSVVGSNVGYSYSGRRQQRWNASIYWKEYLVSTRRLGVYAKTEFGIQQRIVTVGSKGDKDHITNTFLIGQIGAGAEYRITPKFSVFGEGNYLRVKYKQESRGYFSWTTGLRFRF